MNLHLRLEGREMRLSKLAVHGGGLPGSVVTQQRGHVALVEGHVQVLNGHPVAVDLAEAVEGDAHWQVREVLAGLGRQSAVAWGEARGRVGNRESR